MTPVDVPLRRVLMGGSGFEGSSAPKNGRAIKAAKIRKLGLCGLDWLIVNVDNCYHSLLIVLTVGPLYIIAFDFLKCWAVNQEMLAEPSSVCTCLPG